jgi:hypothetical protein
MCIRIVAALVIVAASCATAAKTPCRFAPLFDGNAVATNQTVAAEFLDAHVDWEKRFIRTIGVDPLTKLCYDGHRLDYDTGMPYHQPHLFAAPSKESIHVGVLARILKDANSPHSAGYRSLRIYDTMDEVFHVLESKIDALDQFTRDFPGYGGFFPWYSFYNTTDAETNKTVTKIKPIENGWTNRVPALDNGELFWAAFDLAFVLHRSYADVKDAKGVPLADRWDVVWQRMVKNGVKIFYNGSGNVNCVTVMSNQSLPVELNTYTSAGACMIDDPYEGELFTNMLYLLSDLPEAEKDLLWVRKRAMLKAVNLTVNASGALTNITVQRGFWFSAHEQWKYMMMPYRLSNANAAVFDNGERARTWYASAGGNVGAAPVGSFGGLQQPSPGMWASVNGPVGSNTDNFPYDSACGLPPVAVEQITSDAVITAYSAFPLLLCSNQCAGAAWLHNMLLARKGQNCYGSTESLNVTGATVAPLTTWDSKITTVLASLGGIGDITVDALGLENLLKFVKRIDAEWEREFPDWRKLPGSHLDFQLPMMQVPEVLPDFTTCNSTTDMDSCGPI